MPTPPARAAVTAQEREPNDDAASAQEVPASSVSAAAHAPGDHGAARWADELYRLAVAGTWTHPEDRDCYRIPLAVPATGAVLRVELTPDATGGIATFELTGAEGDRLAVARAAAPGAAVVLPAVGARSWESSYTLCASTVDADTWPARYRLAVISLGPRKPFEFEPNDEPARASALPRGVRHGGYLTADDVDWYRVSWGSLPTLRATLRLPDGVDAELTLCDGSGRPLAEATGSGPDTIETLARGATLARVRAIRGASVDERYDLGVVEVP